MKYTVGTGVSLMIPTSKPLVKKYLTIFQKLMMQRGDNMSKRKVGKRKSKRTKKQPKSTLCNPFRWLGNTKGRHRHSYYRQQLAA